jgi:hypothetical protein
MKNLPVGVAPSAEDEAGPPPKEVVVMDSFSCVVNLERMAPFLAAQGSNVSPRMAASALGRLTPYDHHPAQRVQVIEANGGQGQKGVHLPLFQHQWALERRGSGRLRRRRSLVEGMGRVDLLPFQGRLGAPLPLVGLWLGPPAVRHGHTHSLTTTMDDNQPGPIADSTS